MTFPTQEAYEKLLYGLDEANRFVTSSTLHLFTISKETAILRGEIVLVNGLVIRIREVVNFRQGQIQMYSYAVYDGETKIRWYDPQPHPENPDLTETFPHHYHTDPNIKHNRQPAHGISFTTPNLDTLIQDVLSLKEVS